MDRIDIGYRFIINNSEYIISDIWKKNLLDVRSSLRVAIDDAVGNRVISISMDDAINEINKGRWKSRVSTQE